jgi:uncharacterized tellurite resistance protein B-like protein
MGSLTLTPADVESLTLEQQDAVLEALVVAVVADGSVGQPEVARFNAEVGAVPWGRSMDEVARMAQAAKARIFGLRSDAERLSMLKSISKKLHDSPVREKVLAMMARVSMADHAVNVSETNVLLAFGAAFGISRERTGEIWRALAPPPN